MPVFMLSDQFAFPPPEYAEADGLLAVGGDLSESRLILAYSMGIFPWYSEGCPILWWSPDPRLVLIPSELKISRSLRQEMKRATYIVTFDADFEGVIRQCAGIARQTGEGTWITADMIDAYKCLHRAGVAHSVETWHDDTLVGGLYGVSLGGAFFGESMFTLMRNASKVALAHLAHWVHDGGFKLIDCQVASAHLMRLGAREMPRYEFMRLLSSALQMPTRRGSWTNL